MVWSLYFYFIFSSFLANKGLLNLKRKTCLSGGVECYCSLNFQLLCKTLLPCCGELTPPRYPQANAFQSQNSRLSSQKYGIKHSDHLPPSHLCPQCEALSLWWFTKTPNSLILTCPEKKEISPGSFASGTNKKKKKKGKGKTSNAFSNLLICKCSSRVCVCCSCTASPRGA